MRVALFIAACLLLALVLFLVVGLFVAPGETQSVALSSSPREDVLALDRLAVEARDVRRETSAEEPSPKPSFAEAPAIEDSSAREGVELPDDLRVRVLDGATREALAGVDVHVSWVVENDGARSMTGICAQKTPDSPREVRVARALAEERRSSRGATEQVLVQACGIFPRPIELRLEADPWPTAVQELVLPPHGFVELEVQDELGQRLEVDGSLSLQPVGAVGWTNTPLLAVKRGLSSPRLCGLGVAFDVSGALGDGSKIESCVLRGPLVAGELRRHVVRRAQIGSKLGVRVLLAADEPLRSASVELSIEELNRVGSSMSSSGSTTTEVTDAEGWLRFALDRPQGGAGFQRSFEIVHEHAQRGRLSAFLEGASSYPPGETSLGEVVLRQPREIAAGVVVKRGGKPLKGARVQGVPIDADGEELSLGAVDVQTDSQGRFSLRSSRPVARVKITARRQGHAMSAPIDALPGTRDLLIELDAAASLRGSVVLPPGMDPRSLRVEVQFPSDTGGESSEGSLSADGSFVLKDLAPETGTVVFLPRLGSELARIPDVRFTAGEENRDPRLQNLELCSGWRELSLLLLDASGQALAGAEIDLLAEGQRRPQRRRTDREGRVREWHPPEATRFVLRAHGYRTIAFEWAPRLVELQLRSGIRVVLPVEARLPEPISRLRIQLEGPGGARSQPVDVSDGVAELVVPEPGTYDIRPSYVILEDGAMSVRAFALDSPQRVEIDPSDQQRLPVCRIDEAVLRAALQAR
jgi:hypothetical protein